MHSGHPTGIGDGDTGNVPSPAIPDGDQIWPLRSPWGLNTTHLHPLMDEIPVGDRGLGARCHPYSIWRGIFKDR